MLQWVIKFVPNLCDASASPRKLLKGEGEQKTGYTGSRNIGHMEGDIMYENL